MKFKSYLTITRSLNEFFDSANRNHKAEIRVDITLPIINILYRPSPVYMHT